MLLHHRRTAYARSRSASIDKLLDNDSLPARLRAFGGTRRWLWLQDDDVVNAARRLLTHAATVSPEALVASSRRREVGACVLARAAFHHARFARRVEDFTPRSTSGKEQVREWLLHLFVHVPVPLWTLNTLIQHPSTMAVRAAWHAAPLAVLPHLGQGGSLTGADLLPIDVDNKVLARALASSTIGGPRLAVRHAQLVAAKVERRMADAASVWLANDTFGDVDEEKLIARFVRFLARVRYESEELIEVVSAVQMRRRVDVHYSFHDKSAGQVLLESRRDTPRRPALDEYLGPFPPSAIRTGVVDTHAIREIGSGIELKDEGRRMHHCVVQYAGLIAAGVCSVFSVTPLDASSSGVTVEVALKKRVIVQVRGAFNRSPTAAELAVLSSWATLAGLDLAAEVRGK